MTEVDTVDALIDAAEQLFAADGIDRASLRAVMRQAGTDPGAIHYHFGGREELAIAVLDRFLVPLNDRRIELLEDLLAAPDSVRTVAVLVESLVRPDLEIAHQLEERGPGRAQLVGSIYLHPVAFVQSRVEERFAPVAARFMPHLMAVLPHVAAEEVGWRVRWCVFGTLGALLLDPDELFRTSLDHTVARLVPPMAAALAAPHPSQEFS